MASPSMLLRHGQAGCFAGKAQGCSPDSRACCTWPAPSRLPMRMVLAHPIPQAVNVMRSPNRDSIVVWASTSTVPAAAAA